MSNLKRLACCPLIAIFAFSGALAAHASAYDAHPKLVILLVIDQFRADYLDRYRADFKGRGFRLFLDHGAYFEDCYYDYANTKTAPGHATLGTGAYTDGHGISSNSWWDLARNKQRPVTSVEDERYRIVGLPASGKPLPGASPWNLRASTFGDSLRLATKGQAEVFGISLKDRAAILPSGYSANGAFWIDPVSGAFITSSYYMNQLPDWAAEFNASGRIAEAEEEAGLSSTTNFFNEVGGTPAANSYELDFARALIAGEQLGKHPVTDLLIISLSATDIVGHRLGPDSDEEHQMVDSLDQQLDSFSSWLDKNIPGGLADVWVALSADHGVAPVPAQAAQLGMPAATINVAQFTANLNDAMNAKFSPGEKVEYLLPDADLPYLSLNEPAFTAAGINEQEGEEAVQQAVPGALAALTPETPAPGDGQGQAPAKPASEAPPAVPPPASPSGLSSQGSQSAASQETVPASPPPPPVRQPPVPVIVHTYTRQQLAAGELPPSEWGLLLAHSYSPNGGWYVMVIPAAYQLPAMKSGTTHFSPWSYDRHVPLGFYGAPFTPGIYHGRVQPVDLAATLASLLGINQPSASVGQILSQAIHTLPPPPAPRPVGRTRRHASSAAPAASGGANPR